MPQLEFYNTLPTNSETIFFKMVLKTTPFKAILIRGLGVDLEPSIEIPHVNPRCARTGGAVGAIATLIFLEIGKILACSIISGSK